MSAEAEDFAPFEFCLELDSLSFSSFSGVSGTLFGAASFAVEIPLLSVLFEVWRLRDSLGSLGGVMGLSDDFPGCYYFLAAGMTSGESVLSPACPGCCEVALDAAIVGMTGPMVSVK